MALGRSCRAALVASKNQVIGGKRLALALQSIEHKITNASVLRMGFLEGSKDPTGMSNAQKAFWAEYGTVNAPARPAFRTTIAQQSPTWGRKLGLAVKATNYDGAKALALLGQSMRDDLESSIAQWSTPPNAPSTIAKKGFNKPLVDKGDMQRAPDYEVKPK
jgi:hypothetical protein